MTAKPIDLIVGDRVRKRRIDRGFTLEALAQRVDIAPGPLAAYEAGAFRVPARTLWEICRALGVSSQYFFEAQGVDRAAD